MCCGMDIPFLNNMFIGYGVAAEVKKQIQAESKEGVAHDSNLVNY